MPRRAPRLLDLLGRDRRALLAAALVTANGWWALGALFCGYGFAWVGHFFFEKNRPATFKHPLYSFAGDWVMFKDICTGKIPL